MLWTWRKPVWAPGSSARLLAQSLRPTQAQRKPRSASPVGFTIHFLIFKMDESTCLRAMGGSRSYQHPRPLPGVWEEDLHRRGGGHPRRMAESVLSGYRGNGTVTLFIVETLKSLHPQNKGKLWKRKMQSYESFITCLKETRKSTHDIFYLKQHRGHLN